MTTRVDAGAVCRNARVIRSGASEAVAGRGRQGLDAAAGVDGGNGSVTDQLAGGGAECAEVGGALCVLSTPVGEDVQLRRGMALERDESLISLDWFEGAIGVNCNVRQRGGAVTAYASTAESVDTDVEVLGSGHADVDEAAATHLGVVLTTSRGRNDEGLVGIVAVAKPAAEGSGFKVSVLRIVGALENEVGGDVVGVVGKRTVETRGGTGVADEKVAVGVGRRVEILCLLERQGSGEAFAEGLLEADARLPHPAEADVVRGIDGHRQDFGAVVSALLGFGYERPHLSAR